jgi:nucleotidyltransferase substrate binding protein (TIGR01987 family)
MSEQLDLTPLVNAQRRLAEGLLRYQQDIGDTQIRDGLIQRFEFTYEIAQKTLKRFLEATSASPGEYDAMPFSDLIRTANEKDLLLGDWKSWKRFREMRGKTSHTYDEAVALQVVSGIAEFLAEAEFLIGQMQRRSAV